MHGIDHQLTAPYTSAQNGHVEHLHRTLLGRARSMQLACNVPAHLWDEFCATAAYLTNLTMSSSANGTTPHKKWFSTVPSLSHLCEIGCHAFSLIQTHNLKLFCRSTPCTLIGYAPHLKAYRLWDNTTGVIFNSFHVTFVEHLDALPSDLLPGTTFTLDANALPSWETPSPDLTSLSLRSDPSDTYLGTPASILSHAPFLPTFPPESESPSVAPSPVDPPPNPSLPLPSSSSSSPHPTPDTSQVPAAPPAPDTPAPWRSERIATHEQAHASALLAQFSPVSQSHDLLPISIADLSWSLQYVLSAIASGSLEPTIETSDDPKWQDALNSPEWEYWIAGAQDKIRSLEDLQVFVLIPRSALPPGWRPMQGKLVCKHKWDDTGNVIHYKVWYVAKGYAQQYGIDYTKTTAPTTCLKSFCTVLHLAASLNWDLQQFDIKTAFLHGILPEEETAYMEQPPGFEHPGKKDWVWKLMKSIYGMKQASRIWNITFHETVCSWGFERMKNEWCVYRRVSDTGCTIFALHVDDIIAASSSVTETNRFKADLLSKWEISDLSPAKVALGISISWDVSNHTISISQGAFIDRLIERFNQTDAHPCDTPMIAGL